MKIAFVGVGGIAGNYREGEERGYFRQVAHFLKAIETGDQGLVRSDYADAVKTLAVTLAANRSLETGQVEKVLVSAV